MRLQSQLLTNQILISTIVYLAVQIYNHVNSTDEDGILIETAVYSAVRSMNYPLDRSTIETIMQLARNKLQQYKVC